MGGGGGKITQGVAIECDVFQIAVLITGVNIRTNKLQSVRSKL